VGERTAAAGVLIRQRKERKFGGHPGPHVLRKSGKIDGNHRQNEKWLGELAVQPNSSRRSFARRETQVAGEWP
jgi:hypothetical protein